VIVSADWQGGGPDSVGIQRQGAKPPRRNRIFFITKPGNQESSNRFHGFLASLWNCFLVAPLRLCVFALKVFCLVAFCMVADRKVWPAARTGAKGQWPTQGRAGAGFRQPDILAGNWREHHQATAGRWQMTTAIFCRKRNARA
jgi:hypothetical protein